MLSMTLPGGAASNFRTDVLNVSAPFNASNRTPMPMLSVSVVIDMPAPATNSSLAGGAHRHSENDDVPRGDDSIGVRKRFGFHLKTPTKMVKR